MVADNPVHWPIDREGREPLFPCGAAWEPSAMSVSVDHVTCVGCWRARYKQLSNNFADLIYGRIEVRDGKAVVVDCNGKVSGCFRPVTIDRPDHPIVHLGERFPDNSGPACGDGRPGDLAARTAAEVTCQACLRASSEAGWALVKSLRAKLYPESQ